MLDGHKLRWFREQGYLRFLALIAIAFALLSCAPGNAAAQAGTFHHSATAVVEGTVRDAAAKPVSGALVRVEADGQASRETHTDAAGVFELANLPTGSYRVSAEKSGLRSGAGNAIALSEGDRKHIDLVLGSSAGAEAATGSDGIFRCAELYRCRCYGLDGGGRAWVRRDSADERRSGARDDGAESAGRRHSGW